MSKHSKNRTAHSVFSYAERQQLKYGTQKQRVGTDSIKSFEACCLCLHHAEDALCCPQGHLYCKECIYGSLLEQKKEMSRAQKAWEEAQRKQLKEDRADEIDAKEEELKQFERMESGITDVKPEVFKQKEIDESEINPVEKHKNIKRKIKDISDERELRANFWLPSKTPEAAAIVPMAKECTQCPEGKHDLKLKQLITVGFTPANNDPTHYQCPVCLKTFRNGMDVTVLKTCGHTMCSSCVDTLTEMACYVCQKPFKQKHRVALHNPGTGYAGSGAKLEAKKLGPGFI